ncbi:hypothetical protein ABH963_000064 [Bacillus sp. RC55]|uniref:hypothetical protein n=1 Tax=Bacillus sp. RC55 TaxID=3156292 RepID=UPI00383295D5
MKDSKTIKQSERKKEYSDLLVIYEHYIYEVPSKEGYKLTEEDMSNLIKGHVKRFGEVTPLQLEQRLYHEMRTMTEVIESL